MKRSKVNLSCYKLSTFDMGQLIPCGLFEVLPGDTFQHSTSAVIRLSPMAAPIMHNITARIHHFFVPHRLSWEQNDSTTGTFEDFISGGEQGDDTQTVPTFDYQYLPQVNQSLGHYLGLPPLPDAQSTDVNALPFEAYQMIYNEYYRDQHVQQKYTGNRNFTQLINWQKDPFTTARPWPQLGDEVTIPSTNILGPASVNNQTVDTNSDGEAFLNTINEGNRLTAEGTTALHVRQALALQRLAEARARYGSRYTEYLRYAFGVNSSDARLQRPEYLGGGKALLQISEILQTGPETETSTGEYGVGDLYGHGISAMRSNAYRRYFEEHGYVISLISLRPRTQYVNGTDRHFFKLTKEDFYQKELAMMGQQPVYDGELYMHGGIGTNRNVWGWQDRYYEYMSSRSQVCGDFTNELNYWHLGRIFENRPSLNANFLRCDPSKRIFNEQTRHSVWAMIRHNLVARRNILRNPTPRAL